MYLMIIKGQFYLFLNKKLCQLLFISISHLGNSTKHPQPKLFRRTES